MSWSRDKIRELLGKTPQAEERLDASIKRLGYPPHSLTKDQALRLLEGLCADPGVVGIAARFAKVKVLLAKEA